MLTLWMSHLCPVLMMSGLDGINILWLASSAPFLLHRAFWDIKGKMMVRVVPKCTAVCGLSVMASLAVSAQLSAQP